MWAAFIDELADGDANGFTCATLDETHESHCIFTAALASHKNRSVEVVEY